MAGWLIVGSFDLDAGDVELAAVQQAHVGASTVGAATVKTIMLENLAAVQTLALRMNLFYSELCKYLLKILNNKKDLPHLRIPVITFIIPLSFRMVNCCR